MCSLENAVCALHDYLNPIFLGAVLPELLFNQFPRVHYYVTECEREKRVRDKTHLITVRSFPIGDNICVIKLSSLYSNIICY